MDKPFSFCRTTISNIYAISLTQEQKKLLMQRIYNEIHQSGTMSEEQVRSTCNQLNQCYEVRFESIACAMEIIIKLLTGRVATDEVLRSYRKLLSYVSNALDKGTCAKLANYLRRISCIVLENAIASVDSFPVAVMKCILVLMYRFPITNVAERQTIFHAVRSTLEWCRFRPPLYKQCGISTLIRCVIASTKRLPDEVTVATELTVLAHSILDVFYSPQTTAVHPVEVLLRLVYDQIFARLVTEWTTVRSFELLLYVLYGMLKRDIFTHLKLDIVRLLADAIGGGTRRLVRFLCVAKHLRNDILLHKVKTILTIVLSHSLFRYEPATRIVHFRAFVKLIEKMVNDIDLVQLATANFLCLNIPRAKLKIESVCFVFVIRHLDLLEGTSSRSLELDYVYNLIASVNIIYYKRWKIPSFLVKHFIDGLSRYSNTEAFVKNVSQPEKKIQAILSSGPANVRPDKRAENVFGRLPVTVHRIQWLFQLQPDSIDEKLIFHQQIAILQERMILSGDDAWATELLAMFKPETLITVLSTKRATATARLNASVLLSRNSLTGKQLSKVLRKIACLGQQQQTVSAAHWMDWVRAVYGTVHTLDSVSRRKLWCGLANIEQSTCSVEQRMLLVDIRASLLVAMLPDTNAPVL
ncbi:uncharacterized protein LOC128302948 [Anopheles moucheti]|uniref:uncharacterized protein LOC128302948 n=1 Tax=Anopheles moucheti TaxID=186751 RepID=UPI0022F05ADF|nr:uncharacterized protein LOC128302948 [Anopheles moucheti]